MPQKYVVWGFDPGTANFAYCCLHTGSKPSQFKAICAGKLAHTVRPPMENLVPQFKAFERELLALFKENPPDVVVVERFMNRGKQFGDTGEYVSMMIALLISLLSRRYPKVQIYVTQPGVWKVAFNRQRGWTPAKPVRRKKGEPKPKRRTKKVTPPTPLDHLYAYTLCEPHELDSWLMAHFGLCLWHDVDPFSHLADSDLRTILANSLEKVATGKKKRKRKELPCHETAPS